MKKKLVILFCFLSVAFYGIGQKSNFETKVPELLAVNLNPQQQDVSRIISNKNAFIKTIVSQTNVYEQESFVVSYKLYTKLNLWGNIHQTEEPKFKDFDVEELYNSNRQFQSEEYKGQKYYTTILQKIILTPQQKGTLTIPSFRVQLAFQVPTGYYDIFGEKVMTRASKNFATKPIKIKVAPLPSPLPSNFVNIVGNFNISSSISTTRTKVGKPVLIRVAISGEGNINRVPVPNIQLPNSFECDRPSLNQQVNTSDGEFTGTKTIEYIFVPQKSGDYKIPATSVSYFNTESKTFRILSTPEYKVKVNNPISKDSNAIII